MLLHQLSRRVVPAWTTWSKVGTVQTLRWYGADAMEAGKDLRVKDILRKKSSDTPLLKLECTISAMDAAKAMTEKSVGSAIVTKSGKILGIVTERDFLTRLVVASKDPKSELLESITTKDIIAVDENQSAAECMNLMSRQNLRHLPVANKTDIINILSIRDIMMAMAEGQDTELRYLRDMIGSGGHMYSG
eukprot:Clim_evm22s218 gene=Clim_evmTU22s218